MYTVYILKSEKTGKHYVGYTSDIEKRLRYHNGGKNISTKNGIPWRIIYIESFGDRAEAWKREHQIKSYRGGEAFRKLVK